MKITKIHISRFRGFQDQDIELGSQITAIAGQNGTQKSTLLGIITQTFTIKENDDMRAERPICGGSYISAFKDKFRLSPIFDKPGDHEWTISFDSNIPDFTVESIKRSDSPNVRFWKKHARSAGDGYLSLPTIFLSLKRLMPTAEESKIDTNDNLLTEEESIEFKRLHNKILISQTPVSSTTAITSKNKQSVGVSTEYYDWNQNSMGQDNLGKIILALFSFKRLKQKYPNYYKGGILAIDELDATMYPASQVELLKELRKYASELKLQIVFTTHSISLLTAVDQLVNEVKKRPETSSQVKMVYLKRIDNQIHIKQDIDMNAILLDLNVVAVSKKRTHKIIVYTEDYENRIFVKALLKKQNRFVNLVDVNLPCSIIIEMVTKKIPAFIRPYSMSILDGDIRKDKAKMKKVQSTDNILLLPGNDSPEREIATFLNKLSEGDNLWASLADGYSKQVCFRTYSYDSIMAGSESGRQTAKKWFNEQLQFWGRNGVKVLNPYFETIKDDVTVFLSEFNKITKAFIHS